MPFNKTFAVERWVDLDGGNDASAGTRAAPWRTLKKVADTDFVPIGTSTPISVLVHVAGTSGGTNATSTGYDQFTFDAATPSRTAPTEIAFTPWTEADGARPSGAAIARPVLRADVPFSALTQVGASGGYTGTVIYKSNVLSGFPTSGTGNITGVSQVLYRAGVPATLDVDGAWRCHFKIIGANADAEGTIAQALVTAGAYTAWYKTDTRVIYVNLDSDANAAADLSTNASDWSWCPQQTGENFSKIRPIGFTYVGVEGMDFLWGERGPAIFDANTARIQGCRAYEMQVHGIICSYTNFALQDIRITDCEAHGLGQSSVGVTYIGVAGSAGNFDQTNCKIINCKVRRYMLQNPAGITYNRTFLGTWANREYATYPLGIGTADSAAAGFTRDVELVGCTFEDVSPTKTSTIDAGLCVGARHAIPANRDQLGAYPVRFKNCDIRTFGTWFDRSLGTNEGTHAFGFSNCRIRIARPADASSGFPWGFRTAFLTAAPTLAGAGIYYGFFDGTQLTIDVGNGDPSNQYAGIGVNDVSSTTAGLRVFTTFRNSTYTLVTKSPQTTPLFEMNPVSNAAHKILVIDAQNSPMASVGPVGLSLNNGILVARDLPAAGNTARVFLNGTYIGFNQANFTAANTSWTNFLTNVDPQGVQAATVPYIAPDLAPVPQTVSTGNRIGRF